MRIIVYPHAMEIGGSQLNAIQLAGAVRDRGHDVIVVAEPGPLVDVVRELDLEWVPIPERRRRPSPHVANLLTRLVEQRSVDVVHGYEWPPALDAFYGPRLRLGTAVMATILSSSIVPFFPKPIPLLVGTEQLQHAARAEGYPRVSLMEPPVDTDKDRPGACGQQATADFRARYAPDPRLPLAVMVCRLVPELKRESLLTACGAIEELAAAGAPTQLVIVGDGPIRAELAARADQANLRAGRRLVTLTGELADPRPAYDAADVVLGMGGSALRALAFAKPLVVVGEHGFSELLTERTTPMFLADGWYGLGPGSLGEGTTGMRRAMSQVLDDPLRATELGRFGRDLVLTRFSLRAAAETQEEEYRQAIADLLPRRDLAGAALRSARGVLAYKVRRKISRWRGTVAVDDANAQAKLAARRETEPGQVRT
ncbi:MAG TPA: glycosyltransferase family 4 protein [Pseudonocardiaceae bacterium]|jgi:glycosyltransferase involved in cell wall biosynthesis|nr:glycosyltransferase family 4 protein [Pseudonocardiaceae bacterium]